MTRKQFKQMAGWLSIPALFYGIIFGPLFVLDYLEERNYPAGDFPRYNDRGFGGGLWKEYGGLWLVERSQEELLRIKEFDPAYVKLWRCEVDPDIARLLAGKQSVRQVNLEGSKSVDEQFYRELSKSATIERLIIGECGGLTDSCATWFASMGNLVEVRVSECEHITDDFVLAFAESRSLLRFRVDRSPGVSAESMEVLRASGVQVAFTPHQVKK